MKIFFCLLLFGCGKIYPCDGSIVIVHPDSKIEEVGHDVFREGLHVWDEYGCKFRAKDELTDFELSRNSGPVLDVNGIDGRINGNDIGVYWTTGYIDIDLYLFQDTNAAIHTIAHEVGHSMGLDHVPLDRGVAIMNPAIDPNVLKPTVFDYDEWCRLWCMHQTDVGGK